MTRTFTLRRAWSSILAIVGTVTAFSLTAGFIGALLCAQDFARRDIPESPEILPEKIESGEVSVTPDSGVAGEYGTWTVTYRVGSTGIHTGGGVRVQLPDNWSYGPRKSPIVLQATESNHSNYVSANCSRAGVELRTIVEDQPQDVFSKIVRISNMTHSEGYFDLIVRTVLLKGELSDGDRLSIVYGDRSLGSKGMRAGMITGRKMPITFAVDTEGRGQFRLHAKPPSVSIVSGLAAQIILTARSQLLLGESSTLRLAIVDRYCNPMSNFSGEVAIRANPGRADFPSLARFSGERAWEEIRFTPREEGLLRFEGHESGRRLEAISNPILVLSKKPEENIYWGDLHSHTRFSTEDGVGDPEGAYDYAHHVSGLDFYAMSDHVRPPVGDIARGVSLENYDEYNRLADKFNEPGVFATLHAYEASFYAPYGHVIVYFRGAAGPLLFPDALTLPEMWKYLTPGKALTVPHHTLKMPAPIDWTNADNPQFRRNIEIYSGHGSSEEYDPSEPLAFEQSLFTNPSTSQKTGMSVQDAWMKGYRLSTLASSDDHSGHPGQPELGLTAVYAPGLTRESIFDALFHGRTYATTGAHIILDFDINNAMMGGETTIHDEASIHVRAIGTDVIDQVDVLRHLEGTPGFQVIYQTFPAAESVSFIFSDHSAHGNVIYYVRLRQRNLVGGRAVMAWSSPIWLKID
jgi:Protein of unknown function (DUF3604)